MCTWKILSESSRNCVCGIYCDGISHKYNVLGLRNCFLLFVHYLNCTDTIFRGCILLVLRHHKRIQYIETDKFFFFKSNAQHIKWWTSHKYYSNAKKRREHAQHSERNGSSNPNWIQISKNDEPTKSFTIDFKSIYLWIKYASTFKHMITQIIYVFTAYLWTLFFSGSDLNTNTHTHNRSAMVFFHCFHRHRLLVFFFLF